VSDILKTYFAASDHAISSPVGNETVILHTQNGTYFGLDPVATRIWAMLKDGQAPERICETLAAEYDVAPTVLEQDVMAFVAELEGNAIIAPVERPSA
jgi:hypothetical protein